LTHARFPWLEDKILPARQDIFLSHPAWFLPDVRVVGGLVPHNAFSICLNRMQLETGVEEINPMRNARTIRAGRLMIRALSFGGLRCSGYLM
jgi:hypothetical protein